MNNDWATLRLKVTDKATGKLLPCRFHIAQKGGASYTPPSSKKAGGRGMPQVITTEDFKNNLHLCQNDDIRSSHLSAGEATFPVPAGELIIYIARGYEYRPLSKVFAARAGEETYLECELASMENMAEAGWHSGDMHVHFTRNSKRDDAILAHLMAAEGLDAVNNMVFKDSGGIQAHQRKMGQGNSHYQLSHHHQVISGGEEFRDNDMYGHMIAAGIQKRIEPVSVGKQLGRRENYPLFAQVCDWTHEQDGIAGWAHGGVLNKLHESLPVEAALGKLDFIEGIQFNHFMGFYFWYRLLNCGLKLSLTGGSDFPFGTTLLAPWYINLGLDRTYVHTGEGNKFTYDSYTEGIRKGHSFATNGPLLFLQVNESRLGDRINLPLHAKTVRVRARAMGQYPLDCMEIIVNGAVQHTVQGKGGSREIACETDLIIQESAWVAARVRGRVEPKTYGGKTPWNLHAHTSPIYILKGKRPIAQKADATWMADYIRFLAEVYRRVEVFKNEQQREALYGNMAKALSFYEKLLK